MIDYIPILVSGGLAVAWVFTLAAWGSRRDECEREQRRATKVENDLMAANKRIATLAKDNELFRGLVEKEQKRAATAERKLRQNGKTMKDVIEERNGLQEAVGKEQRRAMKAEKELRAAGKQLAARKNEVRVDPGATFFARQNKHGDWYWGFSHNDISITALKKYDSFNAAEARVRQVFPNAKVERR